MNWKQWSVLIIGVLFMGVNLLFPRAYHGSKYLYFASTKWYEVSEMIARELTLLAIVLVIILLLQEREKALNRLQKTALLGGMAFWLFIFLFPPDSYDPMQFNANVFYFHLNWDARLADYPFVTFMQKTLLVFGALLIPLLGYRLNRAHWAGIVLPFSLIPFGQWYYQSALRREDRAYFDQDIFVASAIIIAVWLTAMNIMLYWKKRRSG